MTPGRSRVRRACGLIAAGAAATLVLSGCTGSKVARNPASASAVSSTSAPSSVTTASSTSGPLSPSTPAHQRAAFTAATLTSAEQVLGAAGIATVADESATAALVPVTGTARMSFTTAQVRAMALQLVDGGGISGASLDAAAPAPSGVVPFSYLLASWVSTTSTPAAAAVRAAMGSKNWADAPSVVFPTIALPLFAAAVLAALPPLSTPASSGGPVGTASTAAYHDSQLAITDAAVRDQSGRLTSIISAPCSTVSNFIQGVLDTVFSALQPNSSSSGGIGSTLLGIFSGALALARQAIQSLISALTGAVLNAIKAIAGTAVVIAQVASYLTPWSIGVTADPATVDPGGDGTFTATVDSGPGGATYPAAITDCAGPSGLDLTLPSLTGANAAGTWALSGPIAAGGSTDVTLDEHGANSLPFSANPATASCTSGDESTSSGAATITVTRPGVENLVKLATTMLTNGLGVAGSIVGPVLTSLLSPILDSVTSKLTALLTVTGSGTVAINAPSKSDCTSATPSATSSSPSASASGQPVAFVCPSASLFSSTIGESQLATVGIANSVPGTLLNCIYLPSASAANCAPAAQCVGQAVFIGGSTDGPSNFDPPTVVIPGGAALCNCSAAAYNFVAATGFAANSVITVLGVKNGVQIGFSYDKTLGTAPGLALLRKVFSQ
jgi:hypothetical protein